MWNIVRSLPLRYGAAFLAVGLVVLMKRLLDQFIGEDSPFLLFFAGVMLSSWVGGRGPGLLATVLAVLLSDYFFLTPGEGFLQNPFEENFRLGLFFLEGAVISWGVATLQAAQRALKEADRAKDDFIAMLAHELRNPIAAIHNSVELLRYSPGPREQQLAGDVIERQTQQMKRLVEDLLDIARIRRRQIQLQKETIDLAAIVARAVEMSRPLLGAREQMLAVSLPPETVRLLADPARLVQVFANLLNNAAKYTEAGGQIWLTVERTDGQHEVPGKEVLVKVRDTGTGIPPEMLPRVFDPFVQGNRAGQHAQGGLGIGLAVVRSLVELHGGSVCAFSDGLGRGSEFVVRLPLLADVPCQAATMAALPHERGVAKGHTTPVRIALAEDEPDIRIALTSLFEQLGHTVVCAAANGAELLGPCVKDNVDVVFVDLDMPVMDGLATAEEVAKRGIPVVLISGHPDAAEIVLEQEPVLIRLLKPATLVNLQRDRPSIVSV